MKKYLLPIMALALTFTFVACGDDDDDPKPSNQQQQGGQQGGATTINYLYSFAKSTYALADETTVTLSITNAKDGSSVIANEDIKVTLNVVADETTAEEGTDFEIPTKEVTIQKGKNKVDFTVKGLTAPANDKNTIVIKPSFGIKNVNAGMPDKVKIILVGSFAKELVGTWVMKEIPTDADFLNSYWGGMATFGDEFPVFNSGDELTITETTIKPAFTSNFKNFFKNEATIEPVGSYNGVRSVFTYQPIDLSIYKLTGVNRYFSATEISPSDVAYIGVRNITDEVTNETLLDVYIIDYESHSFAPEFLDPEMYMYGSFDGTPYVANSTGLYINFIMKKKAE